MPDICHTLGLGKHEMKYILHDHLRVRYLSLVGKTLWQLEDVNVKEVRNQISIFNLKKF